MQSTHSALAAVAVTMLLTCTPAAAQPAEVTVSFDGNGFSASSPDLFHGNANLSPGDAFSTRITLANESDRPQLFLLALEVPDVLSSEGQTLLETAKLTIEASDGYPYYIGTLSGNRLPGSIELETCEPGESLDLNVRIEVPSGLGNDYAMSNDMLHWRFTAMPVIDDEPFERYDPWSGLVRGSALGSAYDKTGYDYLPALAIAAGLAVAGIVAFAVGLAIRK